MNIKKNVIFKEKLYHMPNFMSSFNIRDVLTNLPEVFSLGGLKIVPGSSGFMVVGLDYVNSFMMSRGYTWETLLFWPLNRKGEIIPRTTSPGTQTNTGYGYYQTGFEDWRRSYERQVESKRGGAACLLIWDYKKQGLSENVICGTEFTGNSPLFRTHQESKALIDKALKSVMGRLDGKVFVLVDGQGVWWKFNNALGTVWQYTYGAAFVLGRSHKIIILGEGVDFPLLRSILKDSSFFKDAGPPYYLQIAGTYFGAPNAEWIEIPYRSQPSPFALLVASVALCVNLEAEKYDFNYLIEQVYFALTSAFFPLDTLTGEFSSEDEET